MITNRRQVLRGVLQGAVAAMLASRSGLGAAGPSQRIEGHHEPQFAPLYEEFVRSFRERGEHGAAVAVYFGGRPVVDIWGGSADYAQVIPWTRDTIVEMQSITKGLMALCAHALVESGQLDLQAPVARYWPEFAQAGKQAITVQQLISHHAGLIYPDKAPENSMLDWPVFVRSLEKQAPEWQPGTKGAYHSSTIVHLMGELINRAAGKPFPEVFAERFQRPLSLQVYLSSDAASIANCAEYIPNPDNQTYAKILDLNTKLGRAWRPAPRALFVNSAKFFKCEVGNPYGNARGLARLFAALIEGGEIDGVRVLKQDTVSRLRELQWDEEHDETTGFHFRMAMGILLNSSWLDIGPNPNSFGYAGGGGVVVFADPDRKLSFSYTPNYMNSTDQLGDRCQALIHAAYKSIGVPAYKSL